MDEFFELIDLRSGNLMSDYERIEDALEALRDMTQQHGRSAIAELLLMRNRGDEQEVVAMEEELIGLVESFTTRQAVRTS